MRGVSGEGAVCHPEMESVANWAVWRGKKKNPPETLVFKVFGGLLLSARYWT